MPRTIGLPTSNISEVSMKLMSNKDQRIVDTEIELFLYWKLMKSVFVDYVIISTHSVMLHNPINIMLKPAVLEATMWNEDTEIVRLLAPDITFV
jgi:hypothetical protein